MPLRVDLSGLEAAFKAIQAELAQLPDQVRAFVKDGATQARREHAYKNRTGMLQKSTTGVLIKSTRKLIHAQLRMQQRYASYVVSKGLSSIGEIAAGVEVAIEHRLNQIGKR